MLYVSTVIKYDLILYLGIITTKDYISCNFLCINNTELYQLSSVNGSKKKITNLMVFIPKERCLYNDIPMTKTS